MARLADGLTASRVVLALIIGGAVATDRLDAAVVVLVIAWLTDLLDGILARAAPGTTRLGDWDFRVDVSLGASLLAGLVFAQRAPVWLVVGIVVLGVGWTWSTGNPAPAMLMIALAYIWFLLVLYVSRPEWWWLPFAVIPILLVLDWKRFFRVILPAFFQGLAVIAEGETPELPPVLDEWA
jgi:hypothetical protein